MNNKTKEETIVPIFVNWEQMMREQEEAEAEYAAAYHRLFAKCDAVIAVIAGDVSALAKVDDGEIDLAKAFIRQHGAMAQFEANYEACVALKAALNRRNERIFGVGEAAKRLQRFAAARPHRGGTSSAVVSIERR